MLLILHFTLFQVRGFISHMDESNDDIHYTNSNTIHDSSIEINQNANTPSASVNINLVSIFIILKIYTRNI